MTATDYYGCIFGGPVLILITLDLIGRHVMVEHPGPTDCIRLGSAWSA